VMLGWWVLVMAYLAQYAPAVITAEFSATCDKLKKDR
jgi:hypothetical protein